MKRLLCRFLASGVLCLPCAAGAAVTNGTPAIRCDAPVFDFGTLFDQVAVRHAFTIRNVGTADLVIGQVKTSCGCTAARMPRDVIPPGERVDVECTFSVQGRTGSQAKSVFVHSNDPANPVYRLEIKGTVRRRVEVEPPQIMFSRTGAPVNDRAVTVSFVSDQPIRITGMDTSALVFASAALETVQTGRHYRLTVALQPDYVFGPGLTNVAVVLHTDSGVTPDIKVPVMVHTAPEIAVVPPQLMFGEADAGKGPFQRFLLVRNNRGEDFSVLQVETPQPGIQVGTLKIRAGLYRIELAGITPDKALDGARFVVRLRRPDGTELSIAVPVVYRLPP